LNVTELVAELRPVPPYNFPLMLDMLGRITSPTLDRVRDGAYWRLLRVSGGISPGLALIRVTDTGTIDSPRLELALMAAQGDVYHAEAVADVIDQVSQILGVDEDRGDFYAYARAQPELWAIVGPLGGIRWPCAATVFEALAITIIEQQIAWTTALRAQRWLLEWAGNALIHEGEAYFAFPTPDQIAAATVETLTPLKITFKRMRLLIEVAQMAAEGALDLEGLRLGTPEDAYAVLTAIKGIGHWTATWTITRSMGAGHAYVGDNDVALQAAVNRYFYGGEGRIPAAQVSATFARYGVHAGLAAHYTILRWVLDKY
jgi:DNA-3-methyladenine glycosylase II